jgi:hypothetical protein
MKLMAEIRIGSTPLYDVNLHLILKLSKFYIFCSYNNFKTEKNI